MAVQHPHRLRADGGGATDEIAHLKFDPCDFGNENIDNPYFTLTPGTTFTYESETEEGTEEIIVVVTNETKEILGVTATVVQDTVTLDGELIEDTFDWFAQDKEGNVWYLGEDTKEYENGEVVRLKVLGKLELMAQRRES